MNRRAKAITLVLLVLFELAGQQGAFAKNSPMLTWERGQVRQIVLGGEYANSDNQVFLVGGDDFSQAFTEQANTKKDYKIYSIFLGNDFKLGTYAVQVKQGQAVSEFAAGITVVPLKTYQVTRNPVDFFFIVLFLAFVMGNLSVARSRKYEDLVIHSIQTSPETEFSFTNRQIFNAEAFSNLRIRLISSFKTSLFKLLLFRDGELLYRKARPVYGLAPLIGFVLSFLVAVEVQRNGSLGAISTTLLVVVALAAVADMLVGLFATLGFWSMQFASGRINSVRDILIVLSLGLIWVLPGVLSNFFVVFYEKDHAEIKDKRFINACVAATVALATVYTGVKLINSVVENVKENHSLTLFNIACIAVIAFAKEFASSGLQRANSENHVRLDFQQFSVKRITSPMSGFFLFVLADGFLYMWIGKAPVAFIVGILISLPLFFLFVRLSTSRAGSARAIPRSMLNEGIGLTFIVGGIYFFVQRMPLLLDEKLIYTLIFATIAISLHATASLVIDSSDRIQVGAE